MNIGGTPGDDLLIGTAGDDTINGGDGNDTLDGGDGVDLLSGGAGSDSVDGGMGQDFLGYSSANGDNDTLNGGADLDLFHSNITSFGTPPLLTLDASASGVIYRSDWLGGSASALLTNIEKLMFIDLSSEGGVRLSFIGDFSAAGVSGFDVGGFALVTNFDWNAPLIVWGSEVHDEVFASGVTSDTPLFARGLGGDDGLIGGAGGDTLIGGDGFDFILGGSGNDSLAGDADDDTLDGNDGDDFLSGGSGNDQLNGADGDDGFSGGAGDDTLNGGLGSDIVSYLGEVFDPGPSPAGTPGVLVDLALGEGYFGGVLLDHLISIENAIGSNSDDTLIGDAGDNRLDGWTLDDLLIGGAGNDTLLGVTGDDTLIGGAGADSLVGGNSGGGDFASFAGSPAAVRVNLDLGVGAGGDAEGDVYFSLSGVIGSDFNDTLLGVGGNGSLHFITFNDLNNAIDGAAGDDIIQGYGGDDTLVGGVGDDSIFGDFGDDTLIGGAGDDVIKDEQGFDRIFAGIGDDRVDAGQNDDLVRTSNGRDTLIGGFGNDTLGAGAGNDLLRGGDQDDLLIASNGNDRLFGDGGDDTLQGGSGRDTLTGGAGNDQLVGGAGHDGFNFNPGGGADVIADFVAGVGTVDVIRLIGYGAAFDDFADVLAAATLVGADVVIDLGGGDTITLKNVTLASLDASDFLFG